MVPEILAASNQQTGDEPDGGGDADRFPGTFTHELIRALGGLARGFQSLFLPFGKLFFAALESAFHVFSGVAQLIDEGIHAFGCVLANFVCVHGFNCVRVSPSFGPGQVADAPKQPAARPFFFRISSLYETLFFPENNRIAPLTNIAPPAAGLGSRAALDWKALTLKVDCAPPKPTTAIAINPQPTRAVPMNEAIFTIRRHSHRRNIQPGLVFTAIPDQRPRCNLDVSEPMTA
jgi:hypothetical protein